MVRQDIFRELQRNSTLGITIHGMENHNVTLCYYLWVSISLFGHIFLCSGAIERVQSSRREYAAKTIRLHCRMPCLFESLSNSVVNDNVVNVTFSHAILS